MGPLAAAHGLFRIPELLDLIIGELQQHRPSLASLAHVCSTFHEPSIKYLWSSALVHMDHIMNLFPNHLKSIPFSKTMPATKDGWARFQHYSVHVTSIQLDPRLYTPAMFRYLGDQQSLLFPRLHSLDITAPFPDYYPNSEWVLITGPSLRSLVIRSEEEVFQATLALSPHFSAAYTAFWPQLTARSPHLTHLDVCFPFHESLPNAIIVVSPLPLGCLIDLRSFAWNSSIPLNAETLSILGSLPSLSNLVLKGLWPHTNLRDASYFPSLKQLQLSRPIGAIKQFIDAIAYPHLLTQIHLDFGKVNDVEDPSCISRFLQTITHLTDVQFKMNYRHLKWTDIQCLLDCRRMTSFALEVNRGAVGIDDEILHKMANSWRDLEYFLFMHRSNQTTLLGLAPFARFCPKLATLVISVTANLDTYGQEAQQVYEHIIRHPILESSLRRLGMCLYAVNHLDDSFDFLGHRQTASLIQALWPSLRSDDVVMTCQPTNRSNWALDERVSMAMRETEWHMDRVRFQEAIKKRDDEIRSLRDENNSLAEECRRLQQRS